jgi:hypothetical protein
LLRQNLVKGEVIEVKDISVAGIPAIQWLARNPTGKSENLVQFARAYFVRKTRRMYQIAFTAKDVATFQKYAKDRDKFFDSFKFEK